METQKLVQALLIGFVIAAVGIGLFLLMYFVILANQSDTSKLFGSLIIPPLVMILGFGGYFIWQRNRS